MIAFQMKLKVWIRLPQILNASEKENLTQIYADKTITLISFANESAKQINPSSLRFAK